MMAVLRHLLSILLLPFMVVVAIPHWLVRYFPSGGAALPLRLAGLALLLPGLSLFTWCVGLFAGVGRGTLAPWDPPQNFVAEGPYRHARNPMITSVLAILLGQALWIGSPAIGAWAFAFFLINHGYFIFFEEPGLEQRFGETYRIYRANVPRWFPRLNPWMGETGP